MRRLLRLAEKELGPPPCPYAWLVFGSEGRMEQALLTDQDKVKQILLNLLSNAAKFTHDGGKIVVEVKDTESYPTGKAYFFTDVVAFLPFAFMYEQKEYPGLDSKWEITAQELSDSFADLETADLIRERGQHEDLEYFFKHALTQEVVYQSLLSKRRKKH